MQLPARVGKYELEEFLGGGMSHVYRARDTVIGRTVAVKILTEAGCQDAEAKARFLAEARMAGNVAHDNVISIFDFGEDENHRPFMVMEFLRGEDLRLAIKNNHTGDLKQKLKIALQVAKALEYIHSQKIVHRDIKPENIHITGNGVVKLMDFGIAKTEGLAMTRAGYVLGTPYYMSPEQVTGQGITEQVDVYAFGVLLFELLAGVKPITGETVERIFYSILHEPLNLNPLFASNVPQAVCDLVSHCTAKSPADRPQGFRPVCEELEQLIVDYGTPTMAIRQSRVGAPSMELPKPPSNSSVPAVSAPPSAPAPVETAPPESSKKWLVPALACLAVVLVIAAYFVFRPSHAGAGTGTTGTGTALERVKATPTGEMVLVPAGQFLYGENKQPVTLPAFYIDKTEVPNKYYKGFCDATGNPLPDGFPADKPDLPVVNITMIEARAFAEWAHKRLPTAKEWEKAARGPNGLAYPWGDNRDSSKANVGSHQVRPVTDFPQGASPFGALNMVGNVWEFVDEQVTPTEHTVDRFRAALKPPPSEGERWFMMRGIGYQETLSPNVLWDSTTVPSRWKHEDLGFRCAMDAR